MIVNACYQIYSQPESNLLESVYEKILFYELQKSNYPYSGD
ncbi:GxxExxY protein [Aliifodinibius sp. S!AR15-10]